MTKVLNLALKKDVFDELINLKTNEIPIKKNDWWKKRLMDLDTGRFKYFDVASVTSGSSDKYNFEIDHIEARGSFFIVVVVLPKEDEEEPQEEENIDIFDSDFEPDDNPEDRANDEYIEQIIEMQQVNPEVIEPVVVNEPFHTTDDVTIDGKKLLITEEQKRAIIEKFTKQLKQIHEEQKEQEKSDVRPVVMKLLDEFCKKNDVFVVNMPNVTIRFNGQIVGYYGGRRLIADRDRDVRFSFKKYELMKYNGTPDDLFVAEVNTSLNKLLQNNYVFINRKACGFETTKTGELIFKVTAIEVKKYLFRR